MTYQTPPDYFKTKDEKLTFFTNLLDWLTTDPFAPKLIEYLKFYGANYHAKNIGLMANVKNTEDYAKAEPEFLKNQAMCLAYQEILTYIGEPKSIASMVKTMQSSVISGPGRNEP